MNAPSLLLSPLNAGIPGEESVKAAGTPFPIPLKGLAAPHYPQPGEIKSKERDKEHLTNTMETPASKQRTPACPTPDLYINRNFRCLPQTLSAN